MSTTEWRHDDAGYAAWVAKHRDKFLANILSDSQRQFKVHKASCKLPDRSKEGSINPRTGNQYFKVTADTVGELKLWADQNGYASAFSPCKRCSPHD